MDQLIAYLQQMGMSPENAVAAAQQMLNSSVAGTPRAGRQKPGNMQVTRDFGGTKEFQDPARKPGFGRSPHETADPDQLALQTAYAAAARPQATPGAVVDHLVTKMGLHPAAAAQIAGQLYAGMMTPAPKE